VATDKAYWVADGTAVRLRDLLRRDEHTASSLTAFDARCAAGEYGASRTATMGEGKKRELEAMGKPTEDTVECSDFKRTMWLSIRDDKAVMV